MRLLEMLCKSSWSVEPICALANCKLFIPNVTATQSIEARARHEGRASLYNWNVIHGGY